jgi:hypothetical protein
MKNLTTLNDVELMEAYQEFNDFYEADYSIDYGEFTGGYPEEFYEIDAMFDEEFEKRGIVIESELPC